MVKQTVLINCIFAAASLLTFSVGDAFSQTKPGNKSIRKMEVTEDKFNDGAVKTYTESKVEYDIKGNIVDEIEYNDGVFSKHFSYEYDANNNKIKETEFDKSGKVVKKSVYKYENNLRIEKLVYDSKDKLKSKKTYKYTTF